MILICRFRRSLATAQTNRFALRLARDSARGGTLSPSRAFTAMGLWSYYFWRAHLNEWSTGILPVWQPGVSPGLEFLSAGRMPAGPTAKMAVLLKIQMRGSTSNCQSGRQSNRAARIMKTTRTDLKRKRCPIAVIKSTVARKTVMRTY
jgi:hypothetical protein